MPLFVRFCPFFRPVRESSSEIDSEGQTHPELDATMPLATSHVQDDTDATTPPPTCSIAVRDGFSLPEPAAPGKRPNADPLSGRRQADARPPNSSRATICTTQHTTHLWPRVQRTAVWRIVAFIRVTLRCLSRVAAAIAPVRPSRPAVIPPLIAIAMAIGRLRAAWC